MRSERVNRILSYALSRREAYLTVLLTFVAVVIAIVGGWPVWVIGGCVAAGALLLGLLVADAVADPGVEQEAAFAGVEVSRIRDKRLRSKLERAIEYVRAAQKLARQDRSGALDSADDELPQMEQAVRSMYEMGLRLQEYRGDSLIRRDLADLQRTGARPDRLTGDQRAQLESLKRLEELVRTAEGEIDGALADLGRSYAEMQAIRVTPGLRGQAAESLGQLTASTQRLSDLAVGYDEAYGSRSSRR